MTTLLTPAIQPSKETPSALEKLMWEADQYLNVRLEMVGGLPVWEAWPVLRHQSAAFRIQSSITRSIQPQQDDGSGCQCVHAADIYVRFPDGSLKRPDIAIFCREPDEQDTAVTLLPKAVIEILSQGFEAKDLEIGVPFYQNMGVKDIIVLDPRTNAVQHYQGNSPARELVSPVEINLACGCRCTV